MNELVRKSRRAGMVYYLVIIFGLASQMIRSNITENLEGISLMDSIASNLMLYRVGFFLEMLMILSFLFLPLAFYKLLKKVDQRAAKLMVLFVIVSVPIHCLNRLSQFAPILLINQPRYLELFGPQGLEGMVELFADLNSTGYRIAQIFFGLWLFPLGHMVYKSKFLPKFWGIMLMLGCVGHLIEVSLHFLAPNLLMLSYPGLAISVVAELGFPTWLLIRGIRKKYMEEKSEEGESNE